jgi:hypothetical protein
MVPGGVIAVLLFSGLALQAAVFVLGIVTHHAASRGWPGIPFVVVAAVLLAILSMLCIGCVGYAIGLNSA